MAVCVEQLQDAEQVAKKRFKPKYAANIKGPQSDSDDSKEDTKEKAPKTAEAPKDEEPKTPEAPKDEEPKTEAPKAEETEAPKDETPKAADTDAS